MWVMGCERYGIMKEDGVWESERRRRGEGRCRVEPGLVETPRASLTANGIASRRRPDHAQRSTDKDAESSREAPYKSRAATATHLPMTSPTPRDIPPMLAALHAYSECAVGFFKMPQSRAVSRSRLWPVQLQWVHFVNACTASWSSANRLHRIPCTPQGPLRQGERLDCARRLAACPADFPFDPSPLTNPVPSSFHRSGESLPFKTKLCELLLASSPVCCL